MIHFNFIVDETDAENIMGCISQEICKNMENILKLMDCCDIKDISVTNQIEWFKSRNEYLKELKSKMKNEAI